MKLALSILAFISLIPSLSAQPELAWPESKVTQKPWTRWWWCGSAVDQANITRQLEGMAKAGIGGVEICPIYGAKGAEDRFIDFLSPKWIDMLAHTMRESKRLGIGVDMTTGTGWPFGGPQVDAEHASHAMELIDEQVEGGKSVSLSLPEGQIECLRAYGDDPTKPIDLTGEVKDRKLDWLAPKGNWRILGIAAKSPIQKVKRAAPGGAGNVLDPYSPEAMEVYLKPFDKAFAGFPEPWPRCQFHDSFEYYESSWTPDFFEKFKADCGYDLRDQLPAFAGVGDEETTARVRADYRNTLGDLHRAYLAKWHSWANSHHSLTRNQAHGSPGNLLDLYAVADIPETEMFQHVEDGLIPMMRLSASAAHLTGRNLASCESFTWLDEHFSVKPEQLKDAADFAFTSGVNHIFFHGIPYSPEDAGWPGWVFYASTHMGENGGLWRDMEAFTGYLRRCQSILQNGQDDAEVLLYFPYSDLISDGRPKTPLFTLHNQNEWLHPTQFYKTCMSFLRDGVLWDAASDRALAHAKVSDGRIAIGKRAYAALVVPAAKFMDPETMAKLAELAAQGGHIVSIGELPKNAPGFAKLEARRAALSNSASSLQSATSFAQVDSDSLLDKLTSLGVHAESMAKDGLSFARRSNGASHDYFITNRSKNDFAGIVKFAVPCASAALFDPWSDTPARPVAVADNGIALKLAKGESCIVRSFFTDQKFTIPAPAPALTSKPIDGPWDLQFIEGGPELPAASKNIQLGCWCDLPTDGIRDFSGTGRYTTTFTINDKPATTTEIDLGRVAQTARVYVNGKLAGISWCPPRRLDISNLVKPGENTLAIEVTNLAANRIAAMDRAKKPWKNFHEINFVNIDYQPFDASKWNPTTSGLLGPVVLWSAGE